MKKILFIGILSTFLINLVSAPPLCMNYDDFSNPNLNLERWKEYSNIGFSDEHFVEPVEEVYHVKQNVAMDTETNFQPRKKFISGDAFFYEVRYYPGVGNHFSQPLINGNYPPSQLEDCTSPGGCGPIGYWNGEPDLGAREGVYRINFEFFTDEVKMTAIRPDGVTIVNTFTGNSEPYEFAINTHTGHNGLMHFDFDNFMFCRG